jgi:hypothetical protein
VWPAINRIVRNKLKNHERFFLQGSQRFLLIRSKSIKRGTLAFVVFYSSKENRSFETSRDSLLNKGTEIVTRRKLNFIYKVLQCATKNLFRFCKNLSAGRR